MKFQKNIIFIFTLTIILISFIYCDKDYYAILGVKKNTSKRDIKKQWRRLSQQYHPDINKEEGANERYAEINNAYEILSDDEKRRQYDQYGEKGLQQNLQQQHDPFDIFSQFGGGGQKTENKGPDLPIRVKARLEEIYSGREIHIYLTKQIICPHCRGTGADDPSKVKTCPECNGRGTVIKKQQIAPGFYQQFQGTCDKCFGTGKVFKTKCHVCKGDKIIQGQDEIQLFIEKGIPSGHQVRYNGAGDEYAEKQASDVVFEIIEVQHPIFKRQKDDLYVSLEITLEEALLGFAKELKHLDGHVVVLERAEVTQPGTVQKIENEGMPKHDFPSNYGDLYVTYNVIFDKEYNAEQLKLWNQFFSDK